MKLFIDDIRNAPSPSWIIARDYNSALELIKTGLIEEISFDHDLGEEKTGYDLMVFLEEMIHFNKLSAPIIHIHSANLGAYNKMKLCADRIFNKEN